jgi:EAL domain-containing protein (putative c-di-GMP-specific phosphodiesterase class I)
MVAATRQKGKQSLAPATAPAEVPDWEEPVERLVHALQKDEFELYAQRIAALGERNVYPMAEVLVRMREEEERLLPPGTFLPMFERCGMMPELDRWVMRRSLKRLSQPSRVRCLSLNISAQTLSDADFLPEVAAELARRKVPAAALAFEITEDDALARPTSVGQFAQAARTIGCALTIDGFGCSKVSLAPIQALRPNYVKVDGALVRTLSTSRLARDKLDAIVQLGRKIGIGVIGECVETGDVLACLRSAGAGFAQGYGIHVPAPIDSALK